LSAKDYRLTPLAFWRDNDGVKWPIRWQLELDNRRLTIAAAIEDQRMDTALVYWEGLVHVRDATGAQIGRGYMELTGYR
ncbi:MAG: lipocalin family protein, partial [Pseudomonadales bacterium]